MQPFNYHYFIGYVSQVTPQYIKIHFPSSTLLSKFIFSGEEFNGGLVGTYISIEGENHGFVGQLQEIEVPEKERLSLSESAFKNQEFHPTAKAEILLSFNLFDMDKVTKGANVYPTIGAKVFVCTREFVQKYVQGFGQKKKEEVLLNIGYLNSDDQTEVTVSQQSFFGRHCAIVGTTGGGKSWSLSKLVEEARRNNTKCILLDPTGEYANIHGQHCVLANNSYFSYRKLTISDLFFLLKPSERAQAPKLLEAIKTLKTLEIARNKGGLEGYFSNGEEKNYLVKEGKNKEEFVKFQRNNYEEIDSDELSFDIRYLTWQIQRECIVETDYRDSKLWGKKSDVEAANCISLVTRTHAFVNDKNYKELLGINNSENKEELAETIIKFMMPDNHETLLRIGFEEVGYDFNVREIIANALAKYLLGMARDKAFKEKPIIFFLDEAHQFLNKKVADDSFTAYSLNAFDQIAKECRKYGLFLCIATQMPRDIPVGTLSQMGTFLVHRLINYNDKEAIKQSCATANSSTLSYLPVLGEGEAILTGVDFPMPLLLKVNPPTEKPDSETPQFRIY